MILTSVKDNSQITRAECAAVAASPQMYTAADGQAYQLYDVPMPDGGVQAARARRSRAGSRARSSTRRPAQEIEWQGNWRGLSPAWSSISPKFDNFTTVLDTLNFPMLLRNTLVVAILGTIGAVELGGRRGLRLRPVQDPGPGRPLPAA